MCDRVATSRTGDTLPALWLGSSKRRWRGWPFTLPSPSSRAWRFRRPWARRSLRRQNHGRSTCSLRHQSPPALRSRSRPSLQRPLVRAFRRTTRRRRGSRSSPPLLAPSPKRRGRRTRYYRLHQLPLRWPRAPSISASTGGGRCYPAPPIALRRPARRARNSSSTHRWRKIGSSAVKGAESRSSRH